MKTKKPLKKITCWMPWSIKAETFESWIFGSRKDCIEWIKNQEDAMEVGVDLHIRPVRVEIKEIRKRNRGQNV